MGVIVSGLSVAHAEDRAPINIASQSLESALYDFGGQTGLQVLFAPDLATSKRTAGVADEADAQIALGRLLQGTGLTFRRDGDMFVIVQGGSGDPQSAGAGGDVDALIVTAQKREENIQDVPIAISAFSQEDLTTRQVAGGPDLMTQVPNFTFTKTNFSSYSIQIRGIGTQAISATVDPAVAVAFNNTPFVRNRFFEQEFYDLQRVEVLRGPQGTLYGRNATAGVVNIISAKPSFQYEAKLSGDAANYNSTRLEGMVNIPLAEDIAALRIAGAWTKRDGFVTNEITGNPIDGRDLWSTRMSLRLEPTDRISANLTWEHFEEDDDRLRSGKQLCNKHVTTELGGVQIRDTGGDVFSPIAYISQGCLPASLYSPDSFQTPNGYALTYFGPTGNLSNAVRNDIDPYVSQAQSRDLRVIESTVDPEYRATSNLAHLAVDIDLGQALTLSSETAYLRDSLFSMQDFNRFNTREGAFLPGGGVGFPTDENGVFCDPQLGCSSRLVVVDLSTAKSTQFSQEFRLSSDFEGPFNFSLGANFLRYDTEDKYYVFINSLTMLAATLARGQYDLPWYPGVTDNSDCLLDMLPGDPNRIQRLTFCIYVDPNPIGSLNDQGHNYFLSKNPYKLISYAAFGEAYYDLTPNLKITAGLRWTVDKKEAPQVPSWLIAAHSVGYPVRKVIEQEWREPTGRLTIDWKPALAFTDETLVYASYARGYKAGGANPPPPALAVYGGDFIGPRVLESITHPETFDAEYVDAVEIGSKNTLLDGALTFNGNLFYYDYRGYQISQIVDRSAVNLNFDAEVWGAEIEAEWRPLENLRLGFKGGYEKTKMAEGSSAIDLIDRTAGDPDYVLIKPFAGIPSNCIIPTTLATYIAITNTFFLSSGPHGNGVCVEAYILGNDPITGDPYEPDPIPGYSGFDPSTAPNNGEGIAKDLSGNELPNAPHYTATLTADYTLPLPSDWLMTLHADFYYQSEAWTRVFNMEGYDKLKAYTNINFAAIFTNEDAGWHVMAYVKNVFDRDSITGAFLNSDDTGLTTNVFLTEPRLYGLRVTKQWTGMPWNLGDGGATGDYPFTVQLGGSIARIDAENVAIGPGVEGFSAALDPLNAQTANLDWGDGREVKLIYRPSGGLWRLALGLRHGETNGKNGAVRKERGLGFCASFTPCRPDNLRYKYNYSITDTYDREEHTIADFTVGRDVGLGLLGEGASSTVNLGLRYGQFGSVTDASIMGVPDYYANSDWSIMYPFHNHRVQTSFSTDRDFEGLGPVLSWDAAKRLWQTDADGGFNFDWNLTGGVLFGKQSMAVRGETEVTYSFTDFSAAVQYENTDTTPIGDSRSDSVAVPFAGASLGFSYEVDRLKIGAGYRWERYFDVIDGGIEARSQQDRTIDGPYFKLAIGFGG